MADIISRGMAAQAQAAAETAEQKVDALPRGLVFKGAVATYADLPANAETGDTYTVQADEFEYAWGKIDDENQWIKLGKDYSSQISEINTKLDTKQATLTAGENITIDDNNVISASGGGSSYTFTNGLTENSGTVTWDLNDVIFKGDYNNLIIKTNKDSTYQANGKNGLTLANGINDYTMTINNGYGSLAFGMGSVVGQYGDNSIAIGRGAQANTGNMFAFGMYNAPSGDKDYQLRLAIGAGTSRQNTKNALALRREGDLFITGDVYTSSDGTGPNGTKLNAVSANPSSTTETLSGITIGDVSYSIGGGGGVTSVNGKTGDVNIWGGRDMEVSEDNEGHIIVQSIYGGGISEGTPITIDTYTGETTFDSANDVMLYSKVYDDTAFEDGAIYYVKATLSDGTNTRIIEGKNRAFYENNKFNIVWLNNEGFGISYSYVNNQVDMWFENGSFGAYTTLSELVIEKTPIIYNPIESKYIPADNSSIVRNNNGELCTLIPVCPTSSDGTYTLQCVVTNGQPTYSWVSVSNN